jgi:hypothetical protein
MNCYQYPLTIYTYYLLIPIPILALLLGSGKSSLIYTMWRSLLGRQCPFSHPPPNYPSYRASGAFGGHSEGQDGVGTAAAISRDTRPQDRDSGDGANDEDDEMDHRVSVAIDPRQVAGYNSKIGPLSTVNVEHIELSWNFLNVRQNSARSNDGSKSSDDEDDDRHTMSRFSNPTSTAATSTTATTTTTTTTTTSQGRSGSQSNIRENGEIVSPSSAVSKPTYGVDYADVHALVHNTSKTNLLADSTSSATTSTIVNTNARQSSIRGAVQQHFFDITVQSACPDTCSGIVFRGTIYHRYIA